MVFTLRYDDLAQTQRAGEVRAHMAGIRGAAVAAPKRRRGVAKLWGVPDDSTHLNLWKQQLGDVPHWVWERTELESLVLADNALTEVSERINELTRLRMLDLGHNSLARVPETLGELERLTDFFICTTTD